MSPSSQPKTREAGRGQLTKEKQENGCGYTRCTVDYWQIGSVISCFIVNFFSGGLSFSYGVLYTYMKEPLGVSEYQMSWLGSLMTGFHGFASVVAPVIIDRKGFRMTTLLGPVLAVAGFIISSQTRNIYLMNFTLGVLPGTGVGFSFVATMVYVNRQFGRWRPVAVGVSMCGMSLGILLWPLLTSGIADIMGWRGALLVQGALLLHLVPCALLIKPKYVVGSPNASLSSDRSTPFLHTLINYLRVLKSPRSIILYIANLFMGLAYFTFSSFIPIYVITSQPGISKTDAALIISLSGFGNLAGRVVFSGTSMMHVKAPQYIYTSSLCLCGISNIIVPLCQHKSAFLANGFVQGLTNGGWTVVITVVLVNLFGIEVLSKTFGSSQCILGIGSLCGPPLQSYIAAVSGIQGLIFYSAGGFYIVSAICILPLLRTANGVSGTKKTALANGLGVRNEGFTAEDTEPACER